MIVLYVLGYFNRNKQNSYAALKIKCDINQQDLKRVDLHFVKNFHSLEVVDRISETQLQVGENSNWIVWRLKS